MKPPHSGPPHPGPLRAGIIGAGFIGGVHAHAVRAAGGVVAATAGRTPERTAHAVQALGAERGAASAAELIAAEDVDVVLVAVAVLLGAGGLYLSRSQALVDDQAYMKGMIPHHSIAIMTSERAHIKDPEVRKLADEIIDAQVREIAEMKRMIARLEANPVPENAPDLASYRDKGVPPPPPSTDESTGINTLQPIR